MQFRRMVMEGGGKVLFSWSLRVGNVGLLLGFCSRAPLRILEDIATDSLRPDVPCDGATIQGFLPHKVCPEKLPHLLQIW